MEPFLWVEQYRPKNVESCILPKDLKDTFNKFVEQGSLPNLILSGVLLVKTGLVSVNP